MARRKQNRVNYYLPVKWPVENKTELIISSPSKTKQSLLLPARQMARRKQNRVNYYQPVENKTELIIICPALTKIAWFLTRRSKTKQS